LATGDVVIASGEHTDSSVGGFVGGGTLSLVPAWSLLSGAVAAAGTRVQVGPVFTSDYIYGGRDKHLARFTAFGVLAVEMEAAGCTSSQRAYSARPWR